MNGPRYIQSNLDEALYRQRCYQIHQDRLKNIKDTKEQVKIMKTQDNLRDKVRESKARNHIFNYNEKNANINRENQVLMNKLIEISKGKWSSISKKPKSSGYRPHSLNLVNRKQESQRITLENYTLARRILQKPSSIKKNSLDQEYMLNRRLQERIRKSSKIPMYLGRGGHLPPLKAITGRQHHLESSLNGGNSVPGELNQTAPGLSHIPGDETDQNLGNISEGNIHARETIDISRTKNSKQQASPRLGTKKKSLAANYQQQSQPKEESKVRAYYADPAKSPPKKLASKKQAGNKKQDEAKKEDQKKEEDQKKDDKEKSEEKAPTNQKKLAHQLSEKKIYGSVSKKSLKKDQSVKNKLNKEESKKAIPQQQPSKKSTEEVQEKKTNEEENVKQQQPTSNDQPVQSGQQDQPKQQQLQSVSVDKQPKPIDEQPKQADNQPKQADDQPKQAAEEIAQDFDLGKGEEKKQTANIMQALEAQDDKGPKPSQDIIEAQAETDQVAAAQQQQQEQKIRQTDGDNDGEQKVDDDEGQKQNDDEAQKQNDDDNTNSKKVDEDDLKQVVGADEAAKPAEIGKEEEEVQEPAV